MDLLDIPPARSLNPSTRSQHLRMLQHEVRSPSDACHQIGRRWWVVGGLTAGATMCIAAAVVLQAGPATDQSLVRCHSMQEVTDGPKFNGTSVAEATPGSGAPIPMVRALEACEDLWRQGVILEGAGGAHPPVLVPLPAPSLVGCLARDGVAEVFPTDTAGDGLCARLGLAELSTVGGGDGAG